MEYGKLLELLNEYDSYWDYDEDYGPYMPGMDRDAYWYHKYYLISKEFGFIKWLVDNDKIDRIIVDNEWCTYEFSELNKLIMLLSIQDNPIEFLISILR